MRRLAPVDGFAHLAALVERLPRTQVVVAGDFVVDEYVYGETDRISREAPVLIVRYEHTDRKPGGAGNAACNLAALGVTVRAVGAVGRDRLGRALLDLLVAAGIDVAGLERVRGLETESKTRILAGGRSTRRQQLLRIDRGRTTPLPASAVAQVVRNLRAASARADAILVSDYGSGTLGPGAIDALRASRRRGVPVCVDSRYGLAGYAGVTMVKPNEPELEDATGMSVTASGALDRAGRALLRRLGCEQVLVTCGRNGMSLFRTDAPPLHVAAHGDQEAVDVAGAGDTVGAVYTAVIAAGGDPGAAMRIANVAGALVVRKPGTATVSRRELLSELRARPDVAAPAPLAPGKGR